MAESQSESDNLREIRTKFVGKWRLVGSENFEDFLKEMGAPYPARKMAGFSKPDCEVSIIDDKVKVNTTTTFWSQEDIIQFDVDYEKEIQKTKMKCHAKYEGGNIHMTMEPIDGSSIKPQKQTRYIEDGNMVLKIEVGDVVAKRIFGRV
ncbi:fatty acid-binding protein, adipocyte-like [Haliotis rufescens]|uniref:fatty acid-binding protein, adipocyte-like n=1 Tax=Haliotis rufescens TaxID=6454 RepID=UPI001EB00B39|nr:fatty acid-binding protein, adipocyte-like [Haliotis rufescens]